MKFKISLVKGKAASLLPTSVRLDGRDATWKDATFSIRFLFVKQLSVKTLGAGTFLLSY